MIGQKLTLFVLIKNPSVIYGESFGDVVSIEAMMNSFAAESQKSYQVLTYLVSKAAKGNLKSQWNSYTNDSFKRYFSCNSAVKDG